MISSPSGIRAVLFDLDGTLVDSEPSYWKAWRSVFQPLGIHLTDIELRSVMGMRPPEVAATFLARRQGSVEGAEPLVDGRVANSPDYLVAKMLDAMASDRNRTEMPGASRAVELARSADLLIAIATSAPQVLAEAAVRAIGMADQFHAVVSSEHERRGKPHPDVFLTAARRLSTPPEQCVVVEDAPNGVIAAKAAGMRCVVIPEKGHDNDVFAEANVRLSSLELLTIDHLTG